ncbi:uncharacterized protein LOC144573125 isoform X2 [Carex rostrata]
MPVPLFQLASDLSVSRLCFGTMTFGEQNTFPQSLSLLNEAFRAGINFFDTAEMYPVPQCRATHGRSEEYLSRWIKDQKIPRDRVILATKVAGPSGQMTWIRGGPHSLDSKNILAAIDSRYVPMFGEIEYDPSKQYTSVPMEEQLNALQKAIDNGKIRYVGLSNETAYGLMKFLQLARNSHLNQKILTIQNAYNLLCRNFDSGLAECCHHERVSLLAYSPMAMGILSGKYFSSGGAPSDARLNIFRGRYSEGESRYKLSNSVVKAAALEYVRIAENYGISPASLAIAFVLNHPIVASVIFGATKLWQLQEVIEAINIRLTTDIILEINEVHARYPNPCP